MNKKLKGTLISEAVRGSGGTVLLYCDKEGKQSQAATYNEDITPLWLKEVSRYNSPLYGPWYADLRWTVPTEFLLG